MVYLKDLKKEKIWGKTCLLRLDLNIEDSELNNSLRINRSLKTIKYLFQNGSRVVILSHKGRPDPKKISNKKYHQDFSLKKEARALAQKLKSTVIFENSFNFAKIAKRIRKSPPGSIFILDGTKITDKIGVIKNFINRTDFFLLGGGMANTFNAARNLPVGESFYEKRDIILAKRFLKSPKIILSLDSIIFQNRILDIGPKTVEKYSQIIKKAKTIIWNGPMGYIENSKFRKGSEAIAEAILKSSASSVVGGGETTLVIQNTKYKIQNTRLFVSTGGGAMLEFFAKKGNLPGLRALNRS